MANDLVLLVDDVPDHVERYATVLRAHQFRVHVCATGAEALDYARTSSPDCGLIDVRLPDMTGWELCSLMKREPGVGEMPIVILAADVSAEAARAGAGSGCSAWLAQPTLPDDLVRVVHHVLAAGVNEPPSSHEAVIGVQECPACAGSRIRATLRMGTIQYYACPECGFRWRVEVPPFESV